jgi:hypothetical protein
MEVLGFQVAVRVDSVSQLLSIPTVALHLKHGSSILQSRQKTVSSQAATMSVEVPAIALPGLRQ